MNKGKFIDAAFMLLAFGLFFIMAGFDKNFENYGFVVRHGWLLLIIAYYAGRGVTKISRNKSKFF